MKGTSGRKGRDNKNLFQGKKKQTILSGKVFAFHFAVASSACHAALQACTVTPKYTVYKYVSAYTRLYTLDVYVCRYNCRGNAPLFFFPTTSRATHPPFSAPPASGAAATTL
jgi:hypothetical protein